MGKVTIELDEVWVKRIQSPWMFWVQALQGVALTFAPFFLYMSGKPHWPAGGLLAGVALGILWFVFGFYLFLGKAVLAELRKVPAAGK